MTQAQKHQKKEIQKGRGQSQTQTANRPQQTRGTRQPNQRNQEELNEEEEEITTGRSGNADFEAEDEDVENPGQARNKKQASDFDQDTRRGAK